jgi:transcription elongation factor GreA
MRERQVYQLTKDGYEDYQKKLQELKKKMKDVAQKIKIAREFGDLSENAEYQEAKKEQAEIDKEIRHITAILQKAKIVNDSSFAEVSIGTKVTLKSEDGKEQILTLVSPQEADISNNKISIQSPIGRELLGKKVEDTIRIVNKRTGATKSFKILNIGR